MKKDLGNKKPDFLIPWLILLTMIFSVSLMLPVDFRDVFMVKGFTMFKCPFLQIAGYGCPLCGMTRAFVNAAHMNFSYSFYMNPAGFLLYMYMVIYTGAGWIYIFIPDESIKKIIEFNAVVPISVVVIGSWLILLVLR